MPKVTALRNGRGERVNVFLGGRFAFSLEVEVVAKESLQVGQELSPEQIEALVRTDGFQRGLNAAFRYLSYRPRSEAEIRGRLQRRGFAHDTIETVMAKLKEQGLVDDIAFAQFWKDNREAFSPRSQRLTTLELRQKGVDGDIIHTVVTEIDDDESAYRSALNKTRRWSFTDYPSFRRRLGEYLRRRGFNYEVSHQTVKRVWQERGNSSG